MTQGNQQQGQQQQAQGQQQQEGQQQSPAQMLTRALIELNYPNQADAIKMQREAGDLIWQIIQSMQQQQQQQGQQ
jgi:hypothetical protein